MKSQERSLGVNTGLNISALAPRGTRATKPETIVFTTTAAAEAGDTTLMLEASAPTILERNQMLTFDGVLVLVTEKTSVSDTPTSVPVDAVEGLEGDGIPAGIDEGEEASWNQMFRVLGTEDSTLTVNDETNPLGSTTYDSGQTLSWAEVQVVGKGWELDRSGEFKARDKAWLIIREAILTGRELWVERVLSDGKNQPYQVERGRAIITSPSVPAPADGIVTASWTFQGQGALDIQDIEEA